MGRKNKLKTQGGKMEFTCEQKELYGTLGSVQSVIPGRSTHPVLSNVLLTAKKDSVNIYGTDLDVSMEAQIPADVSVEGAFAVPAKRLYDLIRELDEGKVSVKRAKERVSISQGSGNFFVSGVSGEDYPQEDREGKTEVELLIPTEEICKMLSATLYAVSADVARIALSGLLLHISSEEIISVGTDGHRLTLVKRKIPVKKDINREIVIPAKTAGHIARMTADKEGDTKIEIGEGTVQFTVGKYKLSSKLITEKFPDYTQVIPKENKKSLIVDKDVLMSAARRAAVLSNPITHLVKFNITKGKIELSCSDYDVGGEAHEEISGEYSDEPISIGFNSSYLLEILRHMESDEVKILLKNALSAALIVPLPQKEDEEYLSILMPLRLPEEE